MTRRRFIILSALLSAFIIAVPFACNESLSVSHYTVFSGKLSGDVRLAFVSDVHNTLYGRNMDELVGAIAELKPDAVVIGGDLFDNEWGEPNSVLLVERLTKMYPCFYSLGNHEFHRYDTGAEQIKREMRARGVYVLDGRTYDLTANGSTVRIHGIDGISSADQLKYCREMISPDMPNIMIDHYPEEFPKLSTMGFDLILSGHAHGGQVRIPPFIKGLYAPGQGFFPKYTSGEYYRGGSEMIVSRGLQRCLRDIIIPRVFNRPELVCITICGERS